jgi:hypothetical protein
MATAHNKIKTKHVKKYYFLQTNIKNSLFYHKIQIGTKKHR